MQQSDGERTGRGVGASFGTQTDRWEGGEGMPNPSRKGGGKKTPQGAPKGQKQHAHQKGKKKWGEMPFCATAVEKTENSNMKTKTGEESRESRK